MDKDTKNQIKTLITSKIKSKLKNYEAETTSAPFFEAIFGKDTIINASIMQSLYTSFGMSIYEQIAVILAKSAGYEAQRQYELLGCANEKIELLINKYGVTPLKSKDLEIGEIKKSITPGKQKKHIESIVDVFIRTPTDEWYIDITTVKPNLKEFRTLRKKMLLWAALRFSNTPPPAKKYKINTCIGIPYNPWSTPNLWSSI